MAIRTYDILLDSYNSTIPEPIVGRQGDKNGAVTLHVTITDRGAAVDLTGQTVNLIAETANGTAVVADGAGVTLTDVVNGKFDYAIPNALWSEAGKITKAYFSLNDTDGQQTTYDLIFIVKKAIDISQDKADDYITVIDGTIRDLKTKADDYIAVIDGTVRDLQSKVDAIYATYQAGDFYNQTQTDSKDAATLASAKSYSDTGDTATLASAKSYTDNQISALPSSTPWQTLTIISPFSVDSVLPQVRRIGSKVYFTGSINTGGNMGDLFKIPVGFRPSNDAHFDVPQRSGNIDYRSRVYFESNVAKIVAFNGEHPIWIDSISYYTDDPMPS